MSGRRALGAALLVGGAVLLYFGFQESTSLASDVSETFTGSPTDQSVWFLVGGAAAVVCGGLLVLFRKSS